VQKYRVHLTDRPDPVDVDVKFVDMCVAESEAPRHGIPSDPSLTPLSLSLVWVWCALRRSGAGVGEFQHFKTVLLDDLETVKGDNPTADPTPPAGLTDSP
jgi:hypothetical protein